MDPKFFDHYFAAWNRHDPVGVARHVADNCVFEDVAMNQIVRGPSEMAEFVAGATASSSDLHFEMCSLLSSGDSYLCEWVMSGTNDGPLRGMPATGRRFSVRGVSVGRLDRDGRIVENRDYSTRAAEPSATAEAAPLTVLPIGDHPGW